MHGYIVHLSSPQFTHFVGYPGAQFPGLTSKHAMQMHNFYSNKVGMRIMLTRLDSPKNVRTVAENMVMV